jgi:hypothetical protein
MNYWVFTVGRTEEPPRVDWLNQWPWHVDLSLFPGTKRPVAVSARDRAVVYGSQKKGFIAVVEVLSHEPEPNEDVRIPAELRQRYPWKLRHQLLVSKAADDNHRATPEDAGIHGQQIVRGPHTKITEDQFHAAVRALLKAAANTAG